jgi:DNA-binding CsgD family transcriptional regulator
MATAPRLVVMTAEVRTLVRRRRDELVHRAVRAAGPAEVFDIASARLRRLVPFDAAVWSVTDPATGLPTGPTRIDDLDGMTAAQCSEHWEGEFLHPDVNAFADLARADRPVGTLRDAVDGDPQRSRRYRRVLRPLGYGDELRAVLRADGKPWGQITLFRREGQPAFSAGDSALVAGLSAPLAGALRSHARLTDTEASPVPDRPGVLVFDAGGALQSVDDQARALLDELPRDRALPSDLGVDVPLWLVATVFRAGAVAYGRGDGIARARIRSRRGRWLVGHASCLRPPGGPRTIVVVLEPASPAEVAPLVVAAYGLTEREQEIMALIARGANTSGIADTLRLSPHTVRDYVKAIFHKVEVGSRGELVAKLFAEHYEPDYHRTISRDQAG